jgi:hypothetical protein
MANDERDIYMELRSGSRNLLGTIGVPSNPMVSDEWIINSLRQKANLPLVEGYDERPEQDDLTLFRNSLAQIVTESGKQAPEPDARGSVQEARRLVHVLYGLFS